MGMNISAIGMASATQRTNAIAHRVANVSTPEPGASNVDLSREMTSLITEENTFAANVGAFRVQDNMLGMLLDLKA